MLNIGNVVILGDSYSTFEGYIPVGYDPYYTKAGREDNDITMVEQTWWYQFINETESDLLLNSSFSGTPICNTGYDAVDCTNISFIGRLDKLIEEKYFEKNKVDTLVIFGATNDSWANSPIGETMYSNWTKEDLFAVLPAIGYLFSRVKECIPDVKTAFIINTELKPVIEDAIKAACEKYGVNAIQLSNIDKSEGHPTIKGMAQIKEQVLLQWK